VNTSRVKKKVEEAVTRAHFALRPDLKRLLERAWRQEKSRRAKKALKWILDNARIARKENLAICQDTGLPVVFIEAGKGIAVNSCLIDIIKEGVENSYRQNCLRPSVVDPLLRGGSSYQGAICHVDLSSRAKGLKITIFPKGFGSENKSQLKMFNPTAKIEEIENFVLDAVKKAGPEACPPFVVGVGIGATAEQALLLAKKALLERIDKSNPDISLSKLEQRLLYKINSLKIGPMGLGGGTTALAVKVKKAPTHIAGLPVGVNISCHALRSASIKIKAR
jgi:fumarate hydratase subunit alpha